MALDPRDPVSLAQALIRCPSVTPAEGGALKLLENVLTPFGFECHRLTMSEPGIHDVENLYARLGTDGPNLCFAGHTDVVPPGDLQAWTAPPFGAEIRDGVLYGRGAADMKGGVACMVAAVLRYLSSGGAKPKGSLSFLITGDEEADAVNGTMKVLDWLRVRDERLDACILGEPTNPAALGDEIKIGRRGSVVAELVVQGVQGHAAYPATFDNPIPKLARIIDRLASARLDDGTAHFEPSHLAVSVISVPNAVSNVIPASARATINIRYNDLWSRPRIAAWLTERCEEAAKDVAAKFTLSFSGTGDVFLTEPGPLVATMAEAVRAVTGKTPRLGTGGGTSDARFIKDACPVIEFGLVNATIHKVDEQAPIADLLALTGIYERFIAAYFARA